MNVRKGCRVAGATILVMVLVGVGVIAYFAHEEKEMFSAAVNGGEDSQDRADMDAHDEFTDHGVEVSKTIAGHTRFGFKFFARLLHERPGRNLFVSPLSVSLALGMLRDGASDRVREEMARALELHGVALDEMDRANARLVSTLAARNPKIEIVLADSLWLREGVAINPDFAARSRRIYAAEITPIDFTDPRSTELVNSWVNEKTSGKIPSIVDGLSPRNVMLLLDAVYFNGVWTRRFLREKTADRDFFPLEGGQKTVSMMNQTDHYRYYEDSSVQAVSLPYGREKEMSLFVVLPAEKIGLAKFLNGFSAGAWEKMLPRFERVEGSITFPKFTVDDAIPLADVLGALGLWSAFDNAASAFDGIAPDLFLSDARQKTRLEVMEEGTIAAAVTAIGVGQGALGGVRKTFVMIVDRPFFLAIRDNRTGALLFMGAIYDPAPGAALQQRTGAPNAVRSRGGGPVVY